MESFFHLQIEYSIDFPISLFRSSGVDDSDPIHYTVDMSVYSDIRHVIEDREDDFCCLDSDTRECLYECKIIRDDSVISAREYGSGFLDET